MNQFYVIDGYFFLYRARHGYPMITGKDGEAVNMIFGFFKMICNLLLQKPYALVIARDAPGGVLRENLLPEYKANRTSMPPEFRSQVLVCKELIDQLGIPSIQVTGYEADDIIYTLAKCNGLNKTGQLVVHAGDKDLKQILEFDHVVIHDPIKDEDWTKEKFVKEWGFVPGAIVDYLSLVGDVSDNVPGARGIGPKGASNLIQKRGTIEAMYDHIDELTDKQKELMLASKDDVLRAKKLIELYEVPDIKTNYNQLKPDFVLRKNIFLDQYHFHSFAKTLDDLKKLWYFTQDGGLF